MNQNSGGWRYGNGGSNQFLYRNEDVDNELLKRAAAVAAPKGLLDTKIEETPIDKYLQQDSGGDYGGGDYGITQGESRPSSGLASDAWGMNKYGIDVGFNPTNAMKGFGLLGPVGALAGIQTTKDPLGQFAYQQLVAQEKRDAMPQSSVASGGGWSSLSPDVQASIATSPDPIGAFADAIGMGGDSMADYGGAGTGYGSNPDSASLDAGDRGEKYGGYIKGPGTSTSDSIPARLSNGEYVIRASAVKKYGKGLLDTINSGKYKG